MQEMFKGLGEGILKLVETIVMKYGTKWFVAAGYLYFLYYLTGKDLAPVTLAILAGGGAIVSIAYFIARRRQETEENQLAAMEEE